MKISRIKTRRFLLQILYARIYGDVDETRFHASFFEGILDFDLDQEYFDTMYKLIVDHNEDILKVIHHFAPKFEIESMLKTNILALCIAITEMLWYPEEIPAKVSINEAIELGKYFGDDSSKAIINGILNSLFLQIENVNIEKLPSYKGIRFFP